MYLAKDIVHMTYYLNLIVYRLAQFSMNCDLIFPISTYSYRNFIMSQIQSTYSYYIIDENLGFNRCKVEFVFFSFCFQTWAAFIAVAGKMKSSE